MKRTLIVIILLFITYLGFSQKSPNKADSIMFNFIKNSELFAEYTQSYDAKVYIKGDSHVINKNFLYPYAPNFLYLEKKAENSLVEAFIDIHYDTPNHFVQQIKATNGNRTKVQDIQERVMEFLNINIYHETLFGERIVFPGTNIALKYYRFEYVSSSDTLSNKIHRIRVRPKIRSQKLISGYIDIVEGFWIISSFDIRGKHGLSQYSVKANFGTTEKDFLLPLNIEMTFNTDLLGNHAINNYKAAFQYLSVTRTEKREKERKLDYDLSPYYSVNIDSIPIIRDSTYWQMNRPIPLTASELNFYHSSLLNDSSILSKTKKSFRFPKGIVNRISFSKDNTHLTYSGILNPLRVSYSKMDGIIYWQKLRLRHVFNNGSEIRFNPNLGILFKKKEVYFSTPISWTFDPEHLGEISFDLRNKNQAYNSNLIKMVNEGIPDSLNFEDFNLDYYKHYHSKLNIGYEITNGLLVRAGVEYDLYDSVKKKEDKNSSSGYIPSERIDEDIEDIVSDKYKSFAPVIEIQWTPKMYYRMNGVRKEFVRSAYPTFSLNFGKGIKNVRGSNSKYTRLEGSIEQKIKTGLLNSFQYFIGAGGFASAESIYFADFHYFQRSNFPKSWNDPIGGVFHLLKGDWYNASNHYIQAHFMYESPFFFFRIFRGITRDIIMERVYLSQLYMPALPSYTEIGYGIGNFLGNIAVFVSLNKGKYESVGVKAAFEL